MDVIILHDIFKFRSDNYFIMQSIRVLIESSNSRICSLFYVYKLISCFPFCKLQSLFIKEVRQLPVQLQVVQRVPFLFELCFDPVETAVPRPEIFRVDQHVFKVKVFFVKSPVPIFASRVNMIASPPRA